MIISLFCKDSDFCLPRTQNNVLPISGYHQCMFLCESEEVGKKLLFFRTPSDWSNLSRQLSVIIQLLLKCFILNLFVQFKVVTLLSHFFYLVFSLLYVVRAVTVDSHYCSCASGCFVSYFGELLLDPLNNKMVHLKGFIPGLNIITRRHNSV